MLPSSLPSFDAVPDTFVTEVLEHWHTRVREQMNRDWADIGNCRPWLYVESLQYLMDVLLCVMGADSPSAVSFSFMNSITYGGECEVLLVWQEPPHDGYIEPFMRADNCSVMRLVDFPWPPMVNFFTRDTTRTDCIKKWAWLMSAALDDMPKKEDC